MFYCISDTHTLHSGPHAGMTCELRPGRCGSQPLQQALQQNRAHLYSASAAVRHAPDVCRALARALQRSRDRQSAETWRQAKTWTRTTLAGATDAIARCQAGLPPHHSTLSRSKQPRGARSEGSFYRFRQHRESFYRNMVDVGWRGR